MEWYGGYTSTSLMNGNYIMPLFSGGFLAKQAAIGDLFGDDVIERASFQSKLMTVMVANQMIGPPLGAALAKITPNMPFYVGWVLQVANAVLMYIEFDETLPPEDRKPLEIKSGKGTGVGTGVGESTVRYGLFGRSIAPARVDIM